jgi:hypothetical protein
MVNRSPYAIMIGIGFGIAVLVGLWLAIQVATGQDLLDQLGIAVVGFIPSTLLVSIGAYRYIQADTEPDVIPDVDVWHQRELVDLLHKNRSISVHDAAQQLGISENDVKESVRQLLELGIFTGDIDWETDTLYSKHTKKLS